MGGQYAYFVASGLETGAMPSAVSPAGGEPPPDAIVVFRGDEGRVGAAYGLSGFFPKTPVIISPANLMQVNQYAAHNHVSGIVNHIIETQARTTFENALYCSRLVKGSGFKSIVLVTSDYHMARSFLLLKTMLLGAEVTIDTIPVSSAVCRHWPDRLKIAYNEMIDSWGSFGEMAYFLLFRHPPDRPANQLATIQWLKSVLLFRV